MAVKVITNNIKHIIFDLDGTLINSAPDLSNSINYMLQKVKRETFSDDIIHNWVGNGASTLVKRALCGERDISEFNDDEIFDNALDIFLENYSQNVCHKTVLYDAVKETLILLKEKNYKLSIVTNKPYKFILPILKKLEIESYFANYIGGDTLAKKKPDPYPLEYICESLHVSTDESIMVGDSKNDIVAANAIGMLNIGVTYGYNYGEDISKYNPTYVVDSFKDIIGIL
jgi:phosphoglycolate phosphatase